MSDLAAFGTLLWFRPNTGDESVIEEVVGTDVYRLNEVDLEGARVVDGGANIGCFAVACVMRGAGRVLAIEPEQDNLRVLRRNAEMYPAIEVVAGALAPTDGTVRVHGKENRAYTMDEPSGGGIKVEALTLDSAIIQLGGAVDVLKLDVEGAEIDVLLGTDLGTLAAIPRIVVEVHGPAVCPWIKRDRRSDIIDHLARSHEVTLLRTLPDLAMIYATRKP